MTTSPRTSRDLLKAKKPSETRLCWHVIRSPQQRPSQPGHPTVCCDPGLGQQCVAGHPFCLFGTRLSSCSSARACDFSVGADRCDRSDVSRTKIDNPLPTRMLAASDEDCALATTGSGMLLPRCGGTLTLSRLPQHAGTTMTSLLYSACLVTVGVSPAAASAGRQPTGVLLMATTELASSRFVDGKRRIVRATTMPTLVPKRCALLV